MIKKIDHLGIAVKSLAEAIPLWEKMLGTKCENIEEVASQKVRTAFLKVGDVWIELLEATSDDSAIAKYIEKNGEGVQHIAFQVADMEKTIRSFGDNGMVVLHQGRYDDDSGAYVYVDSAKALGVTLELLHPDAKK